MPEPIRSTPQPRGPWEEIAIDICGPLPNGESLLVVIDYFARWPEVKGKKVKVVFYIAQYPVRWTAQSASHFLPSLTDLFIPTPFSASPGSILARQQLRAKTKSLTFPPLSIARYSFIQLSEQGRL